MSRVDGTRLELVTHARTRLRSPRHPGVIRSYVVIGFVLRIPRFLGDLHRCHGSDIIISLGPRDIKATEWIEEKLNSKVEANQRCGGVALYGKKTRGRIGNKQTR